MKKTAQNLMNSQLANEQTFLSWLRTSVGIMAFGFVSVKFSLGMREAQSDGQNADWGNDHAVIFGLALVVAGALTTLFSFLRYYKTSRMMRAQRYQYSTALVTALSIVMLAISILMIGYLAGTAFLKAKDVPAAQKGTIEKAAKNL